MIILGLTGSVGMGKSLAASMLAHLRVPVHCSDDAVHRLLGRGGAAVDAVARAFPSAYARQNKAIDRAKLGRIIFGSDAKRQILERIIHPLVRASQKRFMAAARRNRRPVIAFDIPLLFETNAQRIMDYVLVVSAPAFIQQCRVLSRPGMDRARLQAILNRQMSDADKRRRADFVVATGLNRAHTFRQLKTVLARIKKARP